MQVYRTAEPRQIKIYNGLGLTDKIIKVSGLFKTACGIANNCAYYCVLDAIDALRTHPKFKFKVKHSFVKVIKELKKYECRLRMGELFHVSDIIEEERNMLKESLNDSNYFDYWQGLGGAAYTLCKDQRNVFLYKATKAYKNHNIPHAETLAKMLLASKMLYIAVETYRYCQNQALKDYAIHIKWSDTVFHDLSIERIFNLWFEATLAIHDGTTINFDEVEDRNIILASKQLAKRFQENNFLQDCQIVCIKDYEEVFKNKTIKNNIIRECLKLKD